MVIIILILLKLRVGILFLNYEVGICITIFALIQKFKTNYFEQNSAVYVGRKTLPDQINAVSIQ